jgi:hypothetical protein
MSSQRQIKLCLGPDSGELGGGGIGGRIGPGDTGGGGEAHGGGPALKVAAEVHPEVV